MDRVMREFEMFTEPSFSHLRHTRHVIVLGSWYGEYAELDSDASIENVMTPAIRMFSILIDVCLAKMCRLETFVWDGEIPPTQRLMSGLACHGFLHEIQLRLGIDGTPNPLLYPSMTFRYFHHLTTIKLNQINSEDGLRTAGKFLNSTRMLRYIYLEVDQAVNLRFQTVLAQISKTALLPVHTLHATGFAHFGDVHSAFWGRLAPYSLSDLKLVGGYHVSKEAVHDFWRTPSPFQQSIRRLNTNLIDLSLLDFLEASIHIETLIFSACTAYKPEISYQSLVGAIKRGCRGLSCLALYPQGRNEEHYLVTRAAVRTMRTQCPSLREVAFGLESSDCSEIEDVFAIRNLQVLHIQPIFMDPQYQGGDIISLRQSIQGCLLEPKIEHNSSSSLPNRSQGSQAQTLHPMQELEQWVLRHLQAGNAPGLRVIAFAYESPYEIRRNPIRLQKMEVLVPSLIPTELFRASFQEWTTRGAKCLY